MTIQLFVGDGAAARTWYERLFDCRSPDGATPRPGCAHGREWDRRRWPVITAVHLSWRSDVSAS